MALPPRQACLTIQRDLPCGNCRVRNKQLSCVYETGAPPSRDKEPDPPKQSPRNGAPRAGAQDNGLLSSITASWGYSQSGPSTAALMKRIESAAVDGGDETETDRLVHHTRDDSAAVKEKYKGLIRQLPARGYIDKLVALFMKDFNWQYYMVDAHPFYKQLDEWYRLPYSVLSSGPHAMSADLRVFPAVLFQIIATALLTLCDSDADSEFSAMKYAGSMTFEDLAADYSESGATIVNLFGKRNLSLTTIQAEFLRASFSKFTANVIESVSPLRY